MAVIRCSKLMDGKSDESKRRCVELPLINFMNKKIHKHKFLKLEDQLGHFSLSGCAIKV